MSATLVQSVNFGRHTSAEGGGAVNTTVFNAGIAGPSAGNYLIAMATCMGNSLGITISDNLGGAWTLVCSRATATSTTAMWFKVAAGGESTVTFTLSAAGIAIWEVREYSGILGLDTAWQDPREDGTEANTGCTGQPHYTNGLHIFWVACTDSTAQATMNNATTFVRGEIANTGWVLHGASGVAGVPSVDSIGGTQDMRNGTYTGTLLRGWCLDKTSGTGSDKAHISLYAGTSALVSRSYIGAIFRTTSSATVAEGGTGAGAASVIGNGQANSATSTSTSVNVPTHVAGDLLIAILFRDSSVTYTATPAGWTQWGTDWTAKQRSIDGGNNPSAFSEPQTWSVWYRVADGTEPGSYAWTLSGSSTWRAHMVVVRSTGGVYSGTSWQLQAPLGHLHGGGASGGYVVCSGRRPDPGPADCIMFWFNGILNSITGASGWNRTAWTGTSSGELYWRSVALSQPWEFRAVTGGRSDAGGVSFVVFGKALAGASDKWAWVE